MNNDEHDARIAVLERAFVDLLTEFRLIGLMTDDAVDRMISRLTTQTKNKMEAVFLYALFHQYRNSARMQELARGNEEVDAYFAGRNASD